MKPTDRHFTPATRTWIACLLLAALVCGVFGRTIHYEFTNYDDPDYVFKNPGITQGLGWNGVVWAFTHVNHGAWFPVTEITHQLDWQLYGSNAGGHHLTNVLLHALAAIFLFLALQRLTAVFWPALFVASVFAIHPLRAESVAWVVERKDVLSGLFFMLTLWTWARYAQTRTGVTDQNPGLVTASPAFEWRGVTRDYWLALIFFTLGLLSKSMLVTLPASLLLLDFWPLRRLPSNASARPSVYFRTGLGLICEKIPFFALSAAISLVTLSAQKNAVLIAQKSSLYDRIGNALLAYTDYLWHFICPVGLTVAYPHSDASPSLVMVGLSALILISISTVAFIWRRQCPCILVGWLWYLGMLLPVIDIMQAGQSARADRFTYLPQIGLCLSGTWAVLAVTAGRRRIQKLSKIAALVIVAGLAVGAFRQTGYWKNSVSLWSRALACNSKNSFAENNLGTALVSCGNIDEAIRHFKQALLLDPDYPDALVNLGVALINLDRRDEAIPCFEKALQINPYSADAHYNLGDALGSQGKYAEAIHHFELALKSRPDYPGAHYDLGLNLAAENRWDESIPHFEFALNLKLDQADARYVTAIALATQKKWDDAILLNLQALQLKPGFPEAQYRLGIALANEKKWTEAIKSFQKASNLALAQGNASLLEVIRSQLKSCEVALTNTPP